MKHTKFKVTIFALVLVLILSVTAFFAVNFTNKTANAAGVVSVDATLNGSVFSMTGANLVVTNPDPDDENSQYTMFTFGDNEDVVWLRKHLAYSWWQKQPDEEKNEDGIVTVIEHEVEHGLFNMEIGFRAMNFEKFVITFESQQYSKTEKNKTVNYIIFFPNADHSAVTAIVTDDKDATVSGADTYFAPDRISIRFVDTAKEEFPETVAAGEYGVAISPVDSTAEITGVMKNIGGTYSKYSSSSTTPVYPLIFSAEFAKSEDGKESEEKPVEQMVLYSLNNQSFKVTKDSAKEDDSHEFYKGGTVTDNTPAVVCLNTEISHLNVGGSVKLDYQSIDVLRSSPTPTLYYYLLSVDDYKKDDVTAKNYNDYKDVETSDKSGRFKEVKTDTLLDSDSVYYKPVGSDLDGFAENLNVDMAVKVFVKVLDTSGGEESYVFFDWYLDDAHKLNIQGTDFIAVGKDDLGVTYNYGEGKTAFTQDNEVLKKYQAKVDEAAKDLSAGSLSYIYLPSAEELFSDNATAYSNMKISIYYYYGNNKSQNSSLAYNNLSINITQADSCWFTLYATDVANNKMYYMDGDERVEFSTGDIWDIFADEERHDFLPWFHFKVDYKGVQFKETPGQQSTAHVGTQYDSASFEINGVENGYETKYRLFLFNRAKYYKDTGITFTYQQFIENMDKLYEGAETRSYFKEIKEVTETDEDYEEFKDYQWSTTSTSFVPQDGNAFYYMRAEVTDTAYNVDPVTSSLAVVASEEAKALKGDSEWLQNNIASVVLLCVAGVSLIAIILLLVIKPKSKEDIDVQFEQEKSKKKNK